MVTRTFRQVLYRLLLRSLLKVAVVLSPFAVVWWYLGVPGVAGAVCLLVVVWYLWRRHRLLLGKLAAVGAVIALGLVGFYRELWPHVDDYPVVLVVGFSVVALPLLTLLYVTIVDVGHGGVGRERYEVATLWSLLARGVSRLRSGIDWLPIDSLHKKDPDAPWTPHIKPDVSTLILGQTGVGKSVTMKEIASRWEWDGTPIVAHALSEGPGANELEHFFRAHSEYSDEKTPQKIWRISSSGSTCRWDPFEDVEMSVSAMESLADRMLASTEGKETGWSTAAQTILVGALIVTYDEYGDFAHLDDVLDNGLGHLVNDLADIPPAELVHSSITAMGQREQKTAFNHLLNEIRPLLLSDVADEDLPKFSLAHFFETGDGVVILDNIRSDRFARPFWRLFIATAIDLSMETEGESRYLLDEIDKLPAIENLPELASAGRTPESTGVLVSQDIHQWHESYGEMTESIYSNCPNRLLFRAGDTETAELALNSLGETDMLEESETVDAETLAGGSTTHSHVDKLPVTPNEVLNLAIGEALVHSPYGWWLCKLTEPEVHEEIEHIPDRERGNLWTTEWGP